MVRWISDRLVQLPATNDLIEAYERRSELLAQASSELSLPDPGALGEAIIDAGFFSGHRQLVEKMHQETARTRIHQADGEPGWVLLSEIGTAGIPGYRRLEMRLPDGLGLYSQVAMNPDTYQPSYAYEFLRLDPSNGDRIDGEDPFGYASFDDPADWSAALAEARTSPP